LKNGKMNKTLEQIITHVAIPIALGVCIATAYVIGRSDGKEKVINHYHKHEYKHEITIEHKFLPPVFPPVIEPHKKYESEEVKYGGSS